MLTPPLKWAGGKRWLVPQLRPYWYHYNNITPRRLVEPFVGGMAVALALHPDRALLNDINPHLINFYQQLRQGLTIDMLMLNDRAYYNNVRDSFNAKIGTSGERTPQAAAEFYYLIKTGFNGLCRFNQAGLFNVSFGRNPTINYRTEFAEYTAAFRHWHFRWGDYRLIDLLPTDFVYADPPYDAGFTQYSKEGFSWDDQIALAHWLKDHPGPVVVSNHATDRVLELYRDLDFEVQLLDAPRRISCSGDRTPAREMLAIKQEVVEYATA
jgi:DNA adenine methylase